MKKYFLVFLLFLLCACSSKKQVVKTTDTLYNEAKQELTKGNYYFAGESFEKIDEEYPNLANSDDVIAMSAYSYFKAKKYEDSLRMIEYFKRNFTFNEQIYYMRYLEILNYFSKLENIGRASNIAEKGFQFSENFLSDYKSSVYRNDVLEKNEVFKNYIVANELYTIRENLKENNFIGALNHLEIVLKKYDNNAYMEEIYYRLLEIYSYFGYTEEFNKYYRLLEINYSDSDWFNLAKKLKK